MSIERDVAMEIKELSEIAYNNLCSDICYLNGDNAKFKKEAFISAMLCLTGCNIVTTINDFQDDWVTLGIKMIPLLVMVKQTSNLIKDNREMNQSKFYLQLLCEKLKEKGIQINIEDFKNAVLKKSTIESKRFLGDVLLGNEITLSFDTIGEIKYVDSEKNIEITDEVAECCLGDDNLAEYKKNKMIK